MMVNDFDRILDECIDRINRGESLEDCLSAYPAYAERLKPLLQCMHGVKKTYAFTPSADARRAARQKFYAVLDKRRQVTPLAAFFRSIPRPLVWTAVAVVVLAIAGIWGIRPAVNPPTLVASPTGNFAFLISDEINDIGDFESLNVTISRVGLQSANSSGEWLEFTPETTTVDLTRLQGEQSQEIWRGDVPAGQYSQILIYVSEVRGKLKATGQTIVVKLPSNKLHISKPFEVTSETVTHFTFDITVVATGNNGKYILKPQISESGARQEPKPLEPETGENKGKGPK
ncbi:MAG: DUF4382 domain-containing protein [Dehalococcoidales bacterium]|nr:DUF4382 domain-containing protein [Dehalococcoidales bacterium]